MEITPEQLKEIVKSAISEYEEAHPCKLNDSERSMVHAQYEAMVEEGANHGTFRILFQWGVSIKDVTKQVRRWFIILIGIIALAFGAKYFFGG